MALSVAEGTFNTAVDTLKVAWKTYVDTLSAEDVITVVPLDLGDTSEADTNARAATAAGITPSFSKRIVSLHVNDGDVPIQLPDGSGGMFPLFFKLTNQAEDLTA